MNSSNSSLPPSANPPSAPKPPPKPPTGRKPGGQPGHPGHSRPHLPPNQIVPHYPSQCEHCRSPLAADPSPEAPPSIWHQVIELPEMLAMVTEHQAHGRRCDHCGHVTWGLIPPEVLAHGFGPKLTAAIAFLSGRCHGSKRIIEEILETLLGVPISLGSVSNAEAEVAAALEQPYAQAEAAVRQAAVKNADETGWSRAGTLCWVWMAVAAGVALFKICTGRGHAALRELLGPSIGGTIGSDRWGAYTLIDLLARQVCWAHLKRDFQKWVDWGGAAAGVGQAGLKAVERLFAAWRDFRQGVLDRPGLRAALEPVSQDLKAALEGGLSCENKKVVRFCRRVLDIYPALWTFARVEGVEPTNNVAERTLRLAVIWRKISFGNHSEAGCRFVERILTTAQTLRLQGRQVLAYLRDAVAAHRAGQPAPELVTIGA
ncbi:MAG: IS66 family transposase [Planctomycetota bacterium]|nr:IS66 family transposase [Planctomycetota bacterium]